MVKLLLTPMRSLMLISCAGLLVAAASRRHRPASSDQHGHVRDGNGLTVLIERAAAYFSSSTRPVHNGWARDCHVHTFRNVMGDRNETVRKV